MGYKPPARVRNARTTTETARPKAADAKNDDASEADEDGESDWSDWNAKANIGAKRTFNSDRDLGQSTYETTSGADEDDSGLEDEISRADDKATPVHEGSQGLEHIGSTMYNPDHAADEEEEETMASHGSGLSNPQGEAEMVTSDDEGLSKDDSDPEYSMKVVDSVEEVSKSIFQPRPPHKELHNSAEQPQRPDEASEPDSPDLPDFRDATEQGEKMAPARTTTSDRDTSSPSSIFDTVQDSALAGKRLLQNANLKRKRRSAGERVSGREGYPTRKRRKHSIFSPPTSVPPEDEGLPQEPSSGLRAIQGRFKINRQVVKPKSTLDEAVEDQGSMTTWVEPLSHNRSLKHPLFNPSPLKHLLRSRAVDPVAQNAKPYAVSSSGTLHRSTRKSGHSKDDVVPVMEDSSNDEAPSVRKTSRTVFASPKGESKAKPGVNYSSPSNARVRATRLSSNNKSGGERRLALSKSSASDDNSSDRGVEQRSMDDSESSSNVDNSDVEAERSMEDSSASRELICKTCNTKFTRDEQLRSHKKNNAAHTKSYQCWKCEEEFNDKTSLLRHQSQKTHPRETFHARRTGPFSENETRKLEQFMMDYCDNHGIEEPVFRQMMTDSCRRGQNVTWPWPGVTRFDFLNEYYDVLPNRAHKSMQRYKERYFQNLDHKKEWTEEDDKLIIDFVKELGPKWIEIGLRLNRTQDSVTQRYKKKLKGRDAAQSGKWTSREKDALAKAIEDVKDELGLAKTPDTDENIPWFEVSKRMGGIRTAHQCSTHWQRVSRVKHDSRRRSTKRRRKVKSKENVSSDDDEDQDSAKADQHGERFAGVVIPKKPTKRSYHAKPKDSSETDRRDSETHQSPKGAGNRPDVATRGCSSPLLGSSDRDEQDALLSSIEPHSGEFTDPAGEGDNATERTADEWQRILQLEGRALPPITATDTQDGIPNIQGFQASRENETGHASPVVSSATRKSPAANSEAPRNPFNKKTPGKVTALSQVFEQTQVPTSALRRLTPHGLEIPSLNSSRPSPDIALRLRPDISQDLGTSQMQDVRQPLAADADGIEIDYDLEMEEVGHSSVESEKDTDMEDAKEPAHNQRWPDGKHAAALKDSGLEDSDREEQQVPPRPVLRRTANHKEDGALVNGEAESSEEYDTSEEDDESEDESGSEEEMSNSEHGSDVTGGSDEEDDDDEDENDDSNDSMVKDTHNDFMANIKESAKLSKLQSPDSSRRITGESDEESD